MVHFSEVSLGGHEPINRLNVTIKGPINSTILVIVLMLNSLLSISQNFDFRKTRWGMTMEDVKNNEYSTLGLEDKKTSNLIYETTLNRYKVGLKYHFVNNKLAFCIYFFFMNDSLYTSNLEYCKGIYNEIYKLIKEKYGKTRVELNCEANLDSPEMLKFVKEIGAAGFGCKALEIWDLDKTTVRLELGYQYNDNKPPYSLSLSYKSILYEPLLDMEHFDDY